MLDKIALRIAGVKIALKFKGMYREFRDKYPNLPEYVAKDIYKNFVHGKSPDASKSLNTMTGADEWVKELDGLSWKKSVLKLNFKDLSLDTQRRMLERKFGDVNPYKVPNDEERMETQAKIVKGDGKNEPIVLALKPDGYDLIEGWHRTMNLLKLGANENEDPEEWDPVLINAWVGT
jgi:hypothetical protein